MKSEASVDVAVQVTPLRTNVAFYYKIVIAQTMVTPAALKSNSTDEVLFLKMLLKDKPVPLKTALAVVRTVVKMVIVTR